VVLVYCFALRNKEKRIVLGAKLAAEVAEAWFILSNKEGGSPRDCQRGNPLAFLLCSVLPGYENQIGFGTPVTKIINPRRAHRVGWLTIKDW
jgi:hypothetical protein